MQWHGESRLLRRRRREGGSPLLARTEPPPASGGGNFDQPARDFERKKSSTSARFRKEKNTGCARSLSVLPLPAEHDPSGKPGHKINVEDRPCRKLLRKSLRMAPYNQDECNYHSLTSQVSYHEFFMFAFSGPNLRCTPI